MIICSKHEGNGTYREFMLDDTEAADEVQVKTHLRHRTDGEALTGDDWTDAGVIKRAGDTLEAAVLKPGRRGKSAKVGLIKLDDRFSNEIAALQAIAVHYQPVRSLKN